MIQPFPNEDLPQGQQGGAEEKPSTEGDDVLDADFEEVKDDKKNG